MLVSAQCLLGSLARQYRNYVLCSLHVLHQLGLSLSPAEVTAVLLLWLKHPLFYHLPLCDFHHERSPEQPSSKEYFLADSVSVISINIK